jgi:hypothetical protein
VTVPQAGTGIARFWANGNVMGYGAGPTDARAWTDAAGRRWNTDAGEISARGAPPPPPTWGQFAEAVSGIAIAIASRGTGAGATVAAANSNQAALRARVLGNIEASKAARRYSNFDIHLARTSQASAPYGGVDSWAKASLARGSIVYGGYPGQSPFYTDFATVKASSLNADSLYGALQVAKHPARGFRPQIQAYRVLEDITVPSGSADANPQFGPGGGRQFYIPNFSNRLDPIRRFNLNR